MTVPVLISILLYYIIFRVSLKCVIIHETIELCDRMNLHSYLGSVGKPCDLLSFNLNSCKLAF